MATRRRLARQRDPRRGDWKELESKLSTEDKKVEGSRQFRPPVETTLTFEDSRILSDLVNKKIFDEGLDAIDKSTQQDNSTDDSSESSGNADNVENTQLNRQSKIIWRLMSENYHQV